MPKPPYKLKKGMPEFTRTKGAPPLIKTVFRRTIGGTSGAVLNKRATDDVLLALCSKYQDTSDETQATMALGIYEDGPEKVILFALQAGSNGEKALKILEDLQAQMNYSDYDVRPAEQVKSATGLHAEMMIVRELMLRDVLDAGNVTASALGVNLRIVCPEKPVCPDCGGYLRKHWIAHYPVDCGSTSPNWINPRTGACFRAKGKGFTLSVPFYQKAGKAVGSPVESGTRLRAIDRVP
jgi:hypothetical protein